MPITINPTAIADVFEIVPDVARDGRGHFSEVWNARDMSAAGFDIDFVQDNHSYSARRFVLRGLHYQLPPHAQTKLVRVVRGAVFDVAVDLRPFSPNFGKHVGIELSEWRWNQLLIPAGFAHGFLTLEPNTEVVYKVDKHYSAAHDRAIRFDDPDLGIDWPFADSIKIISDKDRDAPMFRHAELPMDAWEVA
jgi:dTDP-4-dehydrorhamnose 3,5-epimerase